MVLKCCVNSCQAQYDRIASLHSFPLAKPELLKKWLDAIPDFSEQPTKAHRVCSRHFSPDSFNVTDQRSRLKFNAVPNIFQEFVVTSKKSTSCHNDAGPIDESHEFSATAVPIQVLTKDVATQVSPRHFKTSTREQQLQRRINILQRRLKRREAKLKNVSHVVNYMKKNKVCTSNLEEILINRFEGFPLELFSNEALNNKKAKGQKRYSNAMKDFALTLYFYSPRAYRFVRSKLNLPHAATIRKWLSEKSCQVGILTEVLNFLQTKVIECPYLKDVGITFDAMAIRSQLIFDKQSDKYWGYTDYGEEISNSDPKKVAKEALVFQMVSYTQKFKCPVAYFFINGITASHQKELLLLTIQKLYSVGITVRSLTCDGCSTNLKTFDLLGCSFNPNSMSTSFQHPCCASRIYCIMDPCHMLKLARNALASDALESEKGSISFKYVRKLHEIQEKHGLKLANSLSSVHINFYQKKMKVNLAAQTLSCGVADAIDFLRNAGEKDFIGSEATTEFIRHFDKIFDLQNSRNAFGKGSKSPLSLSNQSYWQAAFALTESYILNSLKVKNCSILYNAKKTFALGFLINIYSFQQLAMELLNKIEHPIKYFLTYKCSQDHIELYFSAIRGCGGWNNNPSTLQFRWTLRKLLYRNSVKPSINANCQDSEFEGGTIFEFGQNIRAVKRNAENSETDSDDLQKLTDLIDRATLTSFQENVLYYIAGSIVNRFLKKNSCKHCENMILSARALQDHVYSVDVNKYSAFTSFVSRGKLCFPSQGAYDIVKYTEKAFKMEISVGFAGSNNVKKRMVSAVVQYFSPRLFSMFDPKHPIVSTLDDLHEIQVIRWLANAYADVRLQSHAKTMTLNHLGQRATLRQKLHNNILFYNV